MKYALESISRPTRYLWCDHTMNPNTPILIFAYMQPNDPNMSLRENRDIICDIIPNPGNINIYTSGCFILDYFLFPYPLIVDILCSILIP